MTDRGWDISEYRGPWILSILHTCWWGVPLTSSGALYFLPHYGGEGPQPSVGHPLEHVSFVNPLNATMSALLSRAASVPFGSWHLTPGHSCLNYILLLHLSSLKFWNCIRRIRRAQSFLDPGGLSLNPALSHSNCVNMNRKFNLFVPHFPICDWELIIVMLQHPPVRIKWDNICKQAEPLLLYGKDSAAVGIYSSLSLTTQGFKTMTTTLTFLIDVFTRYFFFAWRSLSVLGVIFILPNTIITRSGSFIPLPLSVGWT